MQQSASETPPTANRSARHSERSAVELEWALDDRLFALESMFDVDGPFVAVVIEIPHILLEEGAAGGWAEQQSDGCRGGDATGRMEPGDQQRNSEVGSRSLANWC